MGDDLRAWRRLAGDLLDEEDEEDGEGGGPSAVDPEDLWLLGERLGWTVRVTPSRSAGPGFLDVLFERPPAGVRTRAWTPGRAAVAPPVSPAHLAAPLTNAPLRARQELRLAPELRRHL